MHTSLGQRLSPAAAAVWAKSDRVEGGESLPLYQHLADAADIADSVWEWLPRRTQDLVEEALPVGVRDGRRLLRWLAGVHDVGKCSPQFAISMQLLASSMRDAGFDFGRDPLEFRQVRHGLVGQHALTEWAVDRFAARRPDVRTYAVVVGGHHGAPPTSADLIRLRSDPAAAGSGMWHEVRFELLDAMADYADVGAHLGAWLRNPLPATAQAVLSGAVIVADWIASNTDLFPYEAAEPDRSQRAWAALDLPPPWTPSNSDRSPADLCAARFPHLGGRALTDIQTLAVEAARQCDTAPLMMLEAVMGSGKTEAGLMAAEILAERFGGGGLFVALPTLATSNAMFGRVLRWIGNLEGSQRLSTFLAHGKSALNDDYAGLLASARAHDICDETSPHAEAQVLSWLTGRKKGVLATMTVGTIDQLLFSALQARHVVLRHLAFAGKVVIVDEVHAADDYMRVYLERALEWLAAYGVPVILMSATLPLSQRQALSDAYRRGRGVDSLPLPTDSSYPALTTVTHGELLVRGMSDTPASSTEIVVAPIGDDLSCLADLLRTHLADGGCAAVIRNTVRRAQESADFLRQALQGIEVELVHSRFIATHRAAKETRLVAELGPTGERPHAKVVVGTQVLEQSLDIDFDLMISDLAPVDLILQRVGRLHRHPRSGRPALVANPKLYITGIDSWVDGVPQPERGSAAVYRRGRLLRAAAVLGLDTSSASTVTLPDDVRPLVETAYGAAPPPPVAWRAEMDAADAHDAEVTAEQRHKACGYLMPSPVDLEDLVNCLEQGHATEADADDTPGGASRVRDSEDGIEVLVVQYDETGEVVCLEDGGECAGEPAVYLQGHPPPARVARAIAARSVRLPTWMTRSNADFDSVVTALESQAHDSWQQSPWLAGQLALHLRPDWTQELGGFHVTYDRDDGLLVSRSAVEGT